MVGYRACLLVSWLIVGVLIIIVIRFIAAADTGRFKRVKDGERVGDYRYILAGFNSFSGVIIVIIWATRQKEGALIYRFY